MGNHIVTDMSFAKYRQAEGVAQSSLKNLAKCGRYYLYMRDNPLETDAMKFGRLVHAYILENDKFGSEYYITPKVRRTGKEWQTAQALAGGRQIIFEEDFEAVVAMKESLINNPWFQNVFKNSVREASMFWTDPDTTIECKGRPDGYTETTQADERSTIMFDLKTIVDCTEEKFCSAFYNLGYDIQAPYYMDGFKEVTGRAPDSFLFITIEKKPPYLSTTYTVPFDSAITANGRAKYKDLLRKHKKCSATTFDIGLEEENTLLQFVPEWHKFKETEE